MFIKTGAKHISRKQHLQINKICYGSKENILIKTPKSKSGENKLYFTAKSRYYAVLRCDMNEKTIKNRIAAVRRLTRQKKNDCLILTSPQNVSYITGFTGDDSWAIVIGRKIYFLTDSRYTQQAQNQCIGCKIIEHKKGLAAETAKIINRSKSLKIAAVEDCCSVAVFKKLKKMINTRLKPAADIVESVRRTKDNSEINSIRTAAKIAWQALAKTLPRAKPGVTEKQLAGTLDFEIRKLGSQNSFDTIVAFGPNASLPHHQPSTRKLRKNDTILIDFGAKHNGCCSDLTRCFTVGKITKFYQKAFDAVVAAQSATIKKIAPGVTIKEVDAAARDVIASLNLPVFGHGTGHGLGLQIHEAPFLSKENKGTLTPGDCITIEPGIYIPGKFGIRIEDDILVTETGAKILSAHKRFSPADREITFRR